MGARISVVNVATDSTTVYTGPCLLHGIYVDAALSAHACPIKDDTTTKITLVASLAVGTNLVFPGVLFATSLVVDPDNSGSGTLVVFYEPLDQALR